MILLASPPPGELPVEALLARLRGRRAAIDPGGVGDSPDQGVMLGWLLPRLDGRRRQLLTPYLELLAMRVLAVALRHRLAGVAPAPGLLRQPWLGAGLAALVEAPGEAGAVVSRVERALADSYPFVRGLTREFHDQGPGAVESRLISGILVQNLSAARDPLVSMVLRFEIDLRNLLAVLRHWRWKLRQPPPLLGGGELPSGLLTRIWESGDRRAFTQLATRLKAGSALELEPRAAERQLLASLSRRLCIAGRDPLGLGVILDYLWRGTVAARNRAARLGAEAAAIGLPDEVLL